MATITWGFDFDDVLCLTPRLPASAHFVKKLLIQAPPLHGWGPMRFAPERELLSFAREVQERGDRIVVVSGRRTWVSTSTERWLQQIGLKPDAIVHKPPIERRSTPQFKVDVLRELECRAFVDDDPKNVDAINRAGTCTALLWEAKRAQQIVGALRQLDQRLRETFASQQ